MAGNVVRVATQVTGTAKASSELDKLRDKFERLQKQGAKGFAIGVGAAVTTKAFDLMGMAANAAVGFLGDAAKQAMADEESQNRLGASLRTNVAAWDGNTDAIERNIKAAQRLGFDDETLRDSLTVLVGATNDVAEAQRIQAIAMDLARFKGVDLRTASESLIKVEAGVYRSLKSLGIVLKDGATRTEALAAVQKVAGGQAEAYAATMGGKVTVAQIQFNEAMEQFGAGIAPIAADAMGFLGDAGENLGNAYAAATDKTRGLTEAIDEQQHAAGAQGSILDVLAENWGKAGREAEQYAAELDAMAENADKTDRAHRGLAAAAGTADMKFRRLRTDAERLGKSLKDVKGAAESAASGLAELVFGPAELKAHAEAVAMDIGDTVGELQKLEKIKNPTRAQQADILDLREKLAGLKGDLLETMTKLAALGDQPAKDYLTQWLDKLAGKLKFVDGDTRKLYDDLRKLASVTGGTLPALSPPRIQGKQHGGPVSGWSVVGEGGPELRWSPPGSHIFSNPQSRSMVAAPVSGSDAAARWLPVIAAQLARLTAQEPMAARPQTARGDLARQAAFMPGGRL